VADAVDLITDVASTVDGYVRLDLDRADLAEWAASQGLPLWFETAAMVHGDDLPGDRRRLFTPVMPALG
jgi:hypothetical protein